MSYYKSMYGNAARPICWREAKIVPIKKPNKVDTNPQNYRSISFLPEMGKLLELLLNDCPGKYDHLLKAEQFRFCRGRGTTQQYAIVTEGLTHAINSKETASVAALDLEKAFDRV